MNVVNKKRFRFAAIVGIAACLLTVVLDIGARSFEGTGGILGTLGSIIGFASEVAYILHLPANLVVNTGLRGIPMTEGQMKLIVFVLIFLQWFLIAFAVAMFRYRKKPLNDVH